MSKIDNQATNIDQSKQTTKDIVIDESSNNRHTTEFIKIKYDCNKNDMLNKLPRHIFN